MKDWIPKTTGFFKSIRNAINLAAPPSRYEIHYRIATPVTLTMDGKEYRLLDSSYRGKTSEAGVVAVGKYVYIFEYDQLYDGYTIRGSDGLAWRTYTDDLGVAKRILFYLLLEGFNRETYIKQSEDIKMKDEIQPSNSADVTWKGKTYKAGIVTIGGDVYRLEFDTFHDGYRVYENGLSYMMMPFKTLEETKSYLFNYLIERSDIKLKAQEEHYRKYKAGEASSENWVIDPCGKTGILTVGGDTYKLVYDDEYDAYKAYVNGVYIAMYENDLEEAKSYLSNYLLERSADGEIEFPNISIGHSADYKIKTVDLHEEDAPDFSTVPSLAEKYATGKKVAFCGASTTYTFADGSTLRIIADIGKVPK